MALALRYAAHSDVGLARDGNEDSALASDRLLVLADGMGGHAAGEVASTLAIQAMAELHYEDGADPLATLAAGVADANARIQRDAATSPAHEGMGTTLTAMLWTGRALALAHVGDSRAYLMRGGRLAQVTRDHTYVQSLLDEGRISPEEAESHPARSLILKALGQPGDPDSDLSMLEVKPGDRVLLCSDGLSDVVRPEALAEALRGSDDLPGIAATLVELALAGGGPDNITVVVADVVEVAAPEVVRDDRATAAAPLVVGAAAEPVGGAGSSRAARRDAQRRRRGGADGPGGLATVDEEDDPSDRYDLDDLDDEASRYAPRPARFRRARVLLPLLVGVLAVLAAGWLAWGWSQAQYYVGADSGRVVIYRGLSQEVAGAELNSVAEVPAGLPVAALPTVYREQVAGTIAADDLAGAHAIVDRLRTAACAAARAAQPTPRPSPSASPTAARSPRATATARPSPRPSASRTPTPSPSPSPVLPPGLVCPSPAGSR